MTALSRPAPIVGARISGIGSYRPERIVLNAELVDAIDSSDEWIRERTGIQARHFASADETVMDMATAAAQAALTDAGTDPAEIDLVVIATASHPYPMPDSSMQVAERLGCVNAGTFDLGAACAGFAYAVTTATNMIHGGQAKKVLVVGAEKLTDFLNLEDRGTAFIFGDGAGAFVLEAADYVGIGPTVWGHNGDMAEAITMSHDWITYRNAPDGTPFPTIVMQGQAVFRWALTTVTDVCKQAIAAAGIEVSDLAVFAPHQANMRITDALARGLHLPENIVIARDIATTGNTSAASIPLALTKLREEGTYVSGGYALLVGFGAGLSYAGLVVELP